MKHRKKCEDSCHVFAQRKKAMNVEKKINNDKET